MNETPVQTMIHDKRLAIAALVVGLVIGYAVRASTESDSFMLKDSGSPGVVYKIDTHTGQTWMIMAGTAAPVQ